MIHQSDQTRRTALLAAALCIWEKCRTAVGRPPVFVLCVASSTSRLVRVSPSPLRDLLAQVNESHPILQAGFVFPLDLQL